MKYKIDNLQYCKWTREVFQINREAKLDAVHVTIVYHEDYNELLNKIKHKIDLDNSVIINLDITVICQKIRLEKYKAKIKNNLAKLLRCNKNLINIIGKTADNVGIFGKSEAIGCWATINLIN